ncbi:C4-hydroxylase [Acrodontium crateriforme]|uniref:C4-hydroxylase n=1 Tax=Acrodontium crateriforme TaxID=150365 RepID=A0AAQ3M8A1_9PEZI|nr:C4-hydroxylase [Acrodontium crateriforme]
MANVSVVDNLPPLPDYTFRPLPPLLPWLSDQHLSLALPVIAYWVVSLIFHLIDEWDLFPQYRLHTPAEVLKRNHVSRWHVFRDVVLQQVIQTIFGLTLAYVEPQTMFGKEDYDVAVWAQRIRLAQRAVPAVLAMLGLDAVGIAKGLVGSHATFASILLGGVYPDATQTILQAGVPTTAPAFAVWELQLAKAVYYVGVPFLQFIFAICVVDTWQYFLHRAMHMNKWLYVQFHSRHHRLYVPYAYGALYNHPVEGFCLDTLGTGIAYLLSGMTCRQSMWFFTMSTIKTVDDHCGYCFPWDPLQHLTSNNAGYHDVHHQSWGIKTNFSQPFFTFWDGLLGTKWTGGDVSARYERAKIAAQKKVDDESKPPTITGTSTPTSASDASKASEQASTSRQQVLSDSQNGGPTVLAEEASEEITATQTLSEQVPSTPQSVRRSMRKRATSSGLKGLADRFGESLHGRRSGVLGVENGSR